MKSATASSIFALTSVLGAVALMPASAIAQSAQPADASDASSGDIVVTAQRRSERLVDVPISIGTASSADLERAGPGSLESLTKITPGVFFQRATYGLQPTVRGIGTTFSTQALEQNVAIYIDNIYQPAPTGNVFDLASVAGVEVLKGPQGTLFGRNATGGAILIRTLDPDTTAPAGRFNVSFERFQQIRSSAYINLPIGDKVALNGSVAYRHSRGYIRDIRSGDITNEGRSFTARAKLLVQPTDNLKAIFTFNHTNFDDPTSTLAPNVIPAPSLVTPANSPIATGRFESSRNTQEIVRTRSREYSARVMLDTSIGTITSYTALLRNGLDTTNDQDGTYAGTSLSTGTRAKTFSQEVNLTSLPGQSLSYVIGAFYFRNRITIPFLFSGATRVVDSRREYDSYAAYVDGTYEFGNLAVIAGLRYSYDKRLVDANLYLPAPVVRRVQKKNDSQWTPRLGLRYSLADRTNVYAIYSKGYKGGEFDGTTRTGPGADLETVDAFEVGFKHAGPGVTFNAAAFYYNYKDMQVNATTTQPQPPPLAPLIFNQYYNVPKSRIWGLEMDATYELNDNFSIRGAAAYTNSKYVDFPVAPGYVLNAAGTSYGNVTVDVSGANMVRAPKITASGTLTYKTPVGDNDQFEVNVSPYYSSRVYYTFDNTQSQKAYFTLDAAATYTLDEHVKMSIFGRNLTDTKYVTRITQSGQSLRSVLYGMPRVYGVSLGYQF